MSSVLLFRLSFSAFEHHRQIQSNFPCNWLHKWMTQVFESLQQRKKRKRDREHSIISKIYLFLSYSNKIDSILILFISKSRRKKQQTCSIYLSCYSLWLSLVFADNKKKKAGNIIIFIVKKTVDSFVIIIISTTTCNSHHHFSSRKKIKKKIVRRYIVVI